MEKSETAPSLLMIRRARMLLVGATLLWALSFPLVRGLQIAEKAQVPDMADSTLAGGSLFIRFGLGAVVLLLFYGRGLLNVTGAEWSQALGLGAFGGVGLYLQTLGLAWTDASVSAFLTQLYTLLVPLIVAFRDRRFPSGRVMVACVLVLAGVAMLSPGLLTHLTLGPGEMVILISTGFIAGQIVWVERPLYAGNRSGLVTLIMFAVMAIAAGLGYLTRGGTVGDLGRLLDSSTLWEMTLVLVLLCTVATYFVMNTWQRYVTATEAGLIYCIEPVMATALSAFVPGWISRIASISYTNEILGWALAIGGVLILTATILVATEKPRD